MKNVKEILIEVNDNFHDQAISVKKILDDIDAAGDFDFATVGCGRFSLLVCDYIKNLGKPSVHLGGGNQLLFGIRGKRWDGSFANSDWYGTKDWIRPMPEEIPQYNNLVEGGCYW